MENYLNLPTFKERKYISKLRCSDHGLEVEKGRHQKIPREERKCKLCYINNIETEEHFIFHCNTYDTIKAKHDFKYTLENLFNEENLRKVGKYIADSFEMRAKELEKIRTGNTPECD